MKKNITQRAISHKISIILVIVLVILISSLFPACNRNGSDPSDDHFKTMEVKNKVAHYSFEYRTYYHINGPWVDDNQYRKITSMSISAPKKTMPAPNPELGKASETVSMSYTPAFIEMIVGNTFNRPYITAKETIDNSIRAWGRWEHFKLLERKTVLISGIQGEMASYEVDGFVGPKLLYQSDLAFDHSGMEWYLRLKADVSLADIVKEDLQHIIDTFKILD